LIGAIAGLGGALVGQLAPALFRHADSVSSLRWTPPGAAAYAFTHGLQSDVSGYFLSVATLAVYSAILIVATYWLARRSVLGIGGKRRSTVVKTTSEIRRYGGWELPLLSTETSAIVEKELRYLTRNAQLRIMALMPLLLVVVRIMNANRLGRSVANGSGFDGGLASYAAGMLPTGGVLYVFLILAGLSCNQFAFEEGGMRALILSPVARKKILIGKNIALSIMALVFSTILLLINEVVFHDLTPGVLLFVVLSFVTFAVLISIVGNWLSVRFPKRMQFGKRLNVSGVVGLLLIPMVVMLALPPLGAIAAGYLSQSFVIVYVTLGLWATLALGSYLLVIGSQGESLQRREVEILEVVREPADQ
jgi:ABC-2 type transport system permease protein